MDELCAGLVARGWDVEALPSNRSCRHPQTRYPMREHWRGIEFRRRWRPAFSQASHLGRVGNTTWMLGAWAADLAARPRERRPDVVLSSTDPMLSVVLHPALKGLRRPLRLAHWAFDLYPEAFVANGMLRDNSLATRSLARAARWGYRHCDFLADLGPCMRQRLDAYPTYAQRQTLVPWALDEPNTRPSRHNSERHSLFPGAALTLLYSGNLGRAHSYADVLRLLANLRDAPDIHFAFSIRGHRTEEVKQAAAGLASRTLRFADFCHESQLRHRLAAGDVHVVTLRDGWEGVVVPSKFFGALAAGRPVLFAGPRTSSVAQWIEALGVGWVLSQESAPAVADALRALARSPDRLVALQQHCFETYHTHFARESTIDRWDHALRNLLPPTATRHLR